MHKLKFLHGNAHRDCQRMSEIFRPSPDPLYGVSFTEPIYHMCITCIPKNLTDALALHMDRLAKLDQLRLKF